MSFLYSTANLGHFSPVLSMNTIPPPLEPSALWQPLHKDSYGCLMWVLGYACMSVYLCICVLCRTTLFFVLSTLSEPRYHRSNTATSCGPLLCVCSLCASLRVLTLLMRLSYMYLLWYVTTSSLQHYKIRLCSSKTCVTPGISHRPHLEGERCNIYYIVHTLQQQFAAACLTLYTAV